MSSIKGLHSSGEIIYFTTLPCGRAIKQTQYPDFLLKLHKRKCEHCKITKIDKCKAKYCEEDPYTKVPKFFNILYDKL